MRVAGMMMVMGHAGTARQTTRRTTMGEQLAML